MSADDRPAGATVFGLRTPPLALLALLPAVCVMGVLVGMFPSSDPQYEGDLIAMVRACPLALETVGDDFQRRRFGWQPENGDNLPKLIILNRTVLLRGRGGDARIVASAVRDKGRVPPPWRIRSASLEKGGTSIDLRHCAEASPRGLHLPRTFQTTVAATAGSATVPTGSACTVKVEPTHAIYPCRVTLDCNVPLPGPSTLDAPCGYVIDRNQTHALVAKTTDLPCDCTDPTVDFDERRRAVDLSARDKSWSVVLKW